MYLMDEFVDMAAEQAAVSFPTDAHREVACDLLIGNPHIKTMEMLCLSVKNVCCIPNDRIKTIKVEELQEFGFGVYTFVVPEVAQ